MTDGRPLDERMSDDDLEDIRHDIEKDRNRWLPFKRPEMEPMWRLADFALRGDRDYAEFFVGRKREIRFVERLCRKMIDRARSGGKAVKGATLLLQGAPGAGKTAILEELESRWNGVPESKRAKRRTPMVVRLATHELADEALVTMAIAEAVNPRLAREWRTVVESRVGSGGSLMPGGIGVKEDTSSATTTRPREISLRSLAREMPPVDWKRPVVLMVDEIQNVRMIAEAVHPVVSAFHLAVENLPVVPLYAGLGDSLAALRECGISPRLTKGHRMTVGRLEPVEPGEAARKMLKEFADGPTSRDVDFWAGEIERMSDLWPMHLHNTLTALARGLVEKDRTLAEVDGPGVVELAERWRRDSYADRANTDAMRDAFRLVAKVVADMPDGGVDDDTVIGLIEDHTREERGWRLPTDGRTGGPVRARTFLNHLLHQGTLIEGEDGKYTCPIPSFRSFLMEKGGKPPRLEDQTPNLLDPTEVRDPSSFEDTFE